MTVPLQPVGDAATLRAAYSAFPTGVVAVCASIDGSPVGMAASSFTTVSLEPALVSLCVQPSSTTWPLLRSTSNIGVSVFAADQTALCRQLAGANAHRFDGVSLITADSGSLFIPRAAAMLDCSVHAEIPAGDHELIMLRIHSLYADPSVEPLVFHGSTFRELRSSETR